MLPLIERLIKIPSVSDDFSMCEKCLDVCIEEFKGLPVFIKKEKINGISSVLITTHDTGDLDCLILGHVDVVPAPDKMFTPTIQGDRLFGRGALDMKGSIGVGIHVFKEVVKAKIPLKLGLLIVTDEETGGAHGSAYWAREKGLKATVVLDPDSARPLNTVVEKGKKLLFVKIKVHGQNAHGARPWLGVDANEILMQILFKLRPFFPYFSQDGLLPEGIGWINTMHVGKMCGGSSINTISDYAEAELDFRLIETTTVQEVIEIIQGILPPCAEVEILSEGGLVNNDMSNKYMQAYLQLIKSVSGSEPVFVNVFGGTDGRYFAEKSLVITNQATGENAHEENEWVSLSSLKEMHQIYKNFLFNFKDI